MSVRRQFHRQVQAVVGASLLVKQLVDDLAQELGNCFLGWGRELETFFRRTNYLRPNLKVLDAGCGTGIITMVHYQLAQEKGYAGAQFHAFDLTQNMLESVLKLA